MSVIIFLIILAILVLVHEFGHFIVAKKSGIRVDEFGLGFPPKLLGKKFGETEYSLNAVPFGGFVKIFGENPDAVSIDGPDKARSFQNKNRGIQALVLSAGILMNILFAWLLISIGFMSGLPVPVDEYKGTGEVKDVQLIITSVMPDSPALKADLKAGDVITFIGIREEGITNPKVSEAQDFIASHGNQEITIIHKRGSELLTSTLTPISGIVSDKSAVGISMDMLGKLVLPIHKAFYEGAKTTINLVKVVAVGLFNFLYDILRGHADFSQVTGPVGIAGLVGDAQKLGFIYILQFTAFISLNLAIINLIPFPALDGGRLLFVLIESIKRTRINPKIANTLNAVGFVLLIILMLIVTYRDIIKLF